MEKFVKKRKRIKDERGNRQIGKQFLSKTMMQLLRTYVQTDRSLYVHFVRIEADAKLLEKRREKKFNRYKNDDEKSRLLKSTVLILKRTRHVCRI